MTVDETTMMEEELQKFADNDEEPTYVEYLDSLFDIFEPIIEKIEQFGLDGYQFQVQQHLSDDGTTAEAIVAVPINGNGEPIHIADFYEPISGVTYNHFQVAEVLAAAPQVLLDVTLELFDLINAFRDVNDSLDKLVFVRMLSNRVQDALDNNDIEKASSINKVLVSILGSDQLFDDFVANIEEGVDNEFNELQEIEAEETTEE